MDQLSHHAFSCNCHNFWDMDEHPSRWLSKVPHSPCFRPWCCYLCGIYNRVLWRTQKQLHTLVDCILFKMSLFVLCTTLFLFWVRLDVFHLQYLIMLCFILVGILVFTVLAFIVTNNGSGHSVVGLRYKEYQLQDYHSWFLKQLNDTEKWKRLKSCLVKSEDCNNLSKKYKTLKQYKLAKLSPIEAGCCRPPSECGYPAVNASYYDLSFHPVSSNHDCKLYKNSRAIKCYNCDSCKAGVAQYMKIEWRVVAIFNIVLFLVLSMIYFVGCCARRNAAQSQSRSRSRSKA
ncbi:tetraspanin-10-like isoform X1 [Corylus avellana]|uniref:tetraspanin-10-like isoform X1 n=1 Tax=Corylus avellana TaxID=13451 RepID=UPI00286AD2C4|nr:tetraspanin-10-like isoform X1 [Corylus avellana]